MKNQFHPFVRLSATLLTVTLLAGCSSWFDGDDRKKNNMVKGQRYVPVLNQGQTKATKKGEVPYSQMAASGAAPAQLPAVAAAEDPFNNYDSKGGKSANAHAAPAEDKGLLDGMFSSGNSGSSSTQRKPINSNPDRDTVTRAPTIQQNDYANDPHVLDKGPRTLQVPTGKSKSASVAAPEPTFTDEPKSKSKTAKSKKATKKKPAAANEAKDDIIQSKRGFEADSAATDGLPSLTPLMSGGAPASVKAVPLNTPAATPVRPAEPATKAPSNPAIVPVSPAAKDGAAEVPENEVVEPADDDKAVETLPPVTEKSGRESSFLNHVMSPKPEDPSSKGKPYPSIASVPVKPARLDAVKNAGTADLADMENQRVSAAQDKVALDAEPSDLAPASPPDVIVPLVPTAQTPPVLTDANNENLPSMQNLKPASLTSN